MPELGRLDRVPFLKRCCTMSSRFLCFMPEFSLIERVDNAHEEPIWALAHVKENIFATGSLDESVKIW
jgi:hypothetical protein